MFEIVKNNDETTIKLEGDMVAGRLGDLREEIHAIAKSAAVIILDLKAVNVIDSTMVGMLISTQNLLKQHNGKLVLSDVSDDIVKMLKIMRLDRHFEVIPR